MRPLRAAAVLYILSAGIVSGQIRGVQLPPPASQQASGPSVASPTQSNRQAQEVRTYVDVGVSLNTVVDQVKAAFLAERLSIAGSSAAGVVASDPIVKNPAARFPYTEVYRAVITQTDSGGVSVRLSGTGQNGSAPPYALTSEMVSQNPGPNDSAWALLERLAARLKGASGPGDVRPSAPVVAAFRETARDVAERIRLAADAMPAEQYNVRAAPSLPTFGETVFQVGLVTDDGCSRLGPVPRPQRTPVSSTSSKTSLVGRVAEAFQFCDQVTASVPDSDLANPIQFTFHPGPEPAPRVPRAQALMLLTAYWADAYAQLARSVRLVGRVPPEVCRGGDKVDWNLNPLCDSGFIICKDVGGGRYGLTFTLSDSTYSITSDGKGPYRPVGNVRVVAQRPVGLLMFANPAADSASHRSIRLDLSRPVPGDIGVPRGVVVADRDLELSAQYYSEPDNTAHSVLEIPIGTTVKAPQLDVGFRINGRAHVLQMGPQPFGHCYSDGTAIHGNGTTQGTIWREAEDKWIVDLPAGSIGRLFDNHLGDPNAVNLGLYFVSLHFVVGK